MKINEKNLCVFASTAPFDHEGFLNKRGEVNRAFQRRYFVLKGNLLFYFEKKGDKEPLGLIIVEGCTIELSEESDQYCFEIAFNGNRTYVLSADSQDSMEAWMKALTCAGYEYKKMIVAELQRQLEEIEDARNRFSSESNISQPVTPKPPPRRQNPFNRPAPPPPVKNLCSRTKTNGHVGIDAERDICFKNRTDDGQEHTFTLDCIKQDPCADSSAKIHHSNIEIDNFNSFNFEHLHEKFRKLIMNDILEYQAQKFLNTKPLIEL